MFTTDKEVHVYLDGAIQNIASDRKQSISPPFLDMVLNNAVVEYISSKFPERSQGKDIEATLKRYTDFAVLKTKIEKTPYLDMGLSPVARITKPHDAIKIQAVRTLLLRPFLNTNKTTGKMCTVIFTINDAVISDPSPRIKFSGSSGNGLLDVDIDIKPIISVVGTQKGMFYVYGYIIDLLRNAYGLNVRYESNDGSSKRKIIIDLPVGSDVTSVTSVGNIVGQGVISQVTIPRILSGNATMIKHCSMLSSFESDNLLTDYYSCKNLYLNPTCEMSSNYIDINYTDFLPTLVQVTYIKKPKLFNITTGQVPEITISKDFLDYAVKELLLILNSPMVDRVVNQTNKNL